MSFLEQESIQCPYCGETITVLIEVEDAGDQYIEDCQVCCRPIVFRVVESEAGELQVYAHSENDVF